jgi:hypothetical protein
MKILQEKIHVIMRGKKSLSFFLFYLFVFAVATVHAKQRIILQLKQPLRAENTTLHLSEISTIQGEMRDLETPIELGPVAVVAKAEEENTEFSLQLNVKDSRYGIEVTFVLPKPARVELLILDFYGKNLGTLAEGVYEKGIYPISVDKEKLGDPNGIQFVALKLDGKIVRKKMLTKVH